MEEDVFDESATEMSIIERDWMKRKETHVKVRLLTYNSILKIFFQNKKNKL